MESFFPADPAESNPPPDASCGGAALAEEDNAPKRRQWTLPPWLKNPENAMRAVFLLGPWAAYLMVEYLNNNDPFRSLSWEQVTLNLVWYYLIFWVARMLLGRKGAAAGSAMALCFVFGLANHYVLTFRGRIIFPCDLLCLRVAANVAGNYDYSWDKNVWIAAGILAAYLILIALARLVFRQKGRQRLRRTTVIGSCAGILVFLYAFFFTPLLPTIGIYSQQWKTQANGFLLNFMTSLRYSFVEAPKDYSGDVADEIADAVEDIADDAQPVPLPETPVEQPQNLIVIMNESFADMQASFPNLELSEDPLAFFHSLKENTVRGTMISPVTGGGTANVEFEYLTGDSLAFLPSSTVAYQLYLYDGAPSMVSQVNDLGYHTVAFHPYLASGWNRPSVYSWLGFDAQLYDEDVVDPQLIRDYVSDSSDYAQIYRMTQEREDPVFLFNITMQNHSGYSQGWNNLQRTVTVTGGAATSSVTTQYFSLMKESDNAIRELIEYYSACDETTMIVFFGDHQPPLGTAFYEKLYGKALDDRTLEEVFQEYEVPFFIWANYDIPEEDNLVISSNYLGTLTAQLAGFELTEYQTLLSKLMRELPVATTIGFRTADGVLTDDETTLSPEVQELYEAYRLMAYNHLFDESNHPDGFYE